MSVILLKDLDNMHKVVLGAKSEEHLNKLAKKLENNNIDFKDCFVNFFRY